jgi:hypothetical protein
MQQISGTHIRESQRFELMYTMLRKPDQHTTHILRSVRIWSQTIHISRGQRIVTFLESPTDLDGSHSSREKGLLIQSLACRPTDPRVRTQFLSQAN